jgi:large subunit ribosomal protein L14e
MESQTVTSDRLSLCNHCRRVAYSLNSMVQFTRFVEPGRLALVTYGPLTNKLVTIVDVINQNRVIIDGPTTGVTRQQIPIRWISLTSQKSAEVSRGMRTGLVKKHVAGAIAEFNKTAWAKKLHTREARKSLTDFERFKAMALKKRKAHRVRTQVNKLKKGGK